MRLHRTRGATILDTTVAMMVIAIVVSGLSTALYYTVITSRDEAALSQLVGLKKAIVGEPRSLPIGEKSRLRHGYLGDMGILPVALIDLEVPGSQPNFTIDSLMQLGAGWRGPYVASSLAAGMTDPWGSAIVYNTTPGTSTLTGADTVATLRSIGADGQNGTADDHVVEIYKTETTAKVIGYVKDAFGATVAGVTVTLSYLNNGGIGSATATTDNDGLYTFDNIPHGSKVVQLVPRLSYVRGSGLTSGGNRNTIDFTIENIAKTSIQFNTIKVSWTTDPASDFKVMELNGSSVAMASPVISGTTISVPQQTLDGTGVLQEPFAVDVSGLVMQIPDAVIGTVGTGETIGITLEDFEEIGTNTDVDVTGVTFTVEFSDGSKTLFSPLRKP